MNYRTYDYPRGRINGGVQAVQVSIFTTDIFIYFVHSLILQKTSDYMVHQYGSRRQLG